ncbi:hypothetical protein J6590_066947 [Homalodisca vitripennis]|nr:hypothetical protein J6590_066947 [Homalodisca vitripennis]
MFKTIKEKLERMIAQLKASEAKQSQRVASSAGVTSSYSRASSAAVGSTEERVIFTENRHSHRGRNNFRKDPSRELICKRPQPDNVISDCGYYTH